MNKLHLPPQLLYQRWRGHRSKARQRDRGLGVTRVKKILRETIKSKEKKCLRIFTSYQSISVIPSVIADKKLYPRPSPTWISADARHSIGRQMCHGIAGYRWVPCYEQHIRLVTCSMCSWWSSGTFLILNDVAMLLVVRRSKQCIYRLNTIDGF